MFLAAPSWPKTLGFLAFSALAALWVWLISGPVAMDYFFLSDDFHLMGGAMENSLTTLMLKPHFGYFRPLVHLSVAFQAVFFGWETPSGYAWVSIVIHVLNAGLLIFLFEATGFRTVVAVAAACLFLVAPWTYETIGWASCQFDLTATFFYLSSILCALRAHGQKEPQHSWLRLSWLLFFLALCAKEIAITLPIVIFFLLRAKSAPIAAPGDGSDPHRQQAPGNYWKGALGVLLIYFALRVTTMASSGIFDPLHGAQGNFLVVLLKTNPVANLWSYLQSVVQTPHPSRSERWFDTIHIAYGATIGLLTIAALIKQPRKALMGVGLALLSMLPILWQFRVDGHPLGGRLMYLASIWLVFTLALGLEGILGYRPLGFAWPGPIAALSMWCIFLLHGFASESHQAALWRQSSELARHGVEDFKPYLGHPTPIHIENLPFILKNGPFCLKAYAFRYYYGADMTPDVTVQRRTLFQRKGKMVMMRGNEPSSGARPLNAMSITLPRVP